MMKLTLQCIQSGLLILTVVTGFITSKLIYLST